MFAVIKTGGKQYIVHEGDVLNVEKLDVEAGKSVSFETLLLAEDDGSTVDVGTPTVSKKTTGEVVLHGRAEKVDIVKYKAKSKYHRRVGHRQSFTKIKITKVG